MSSKKKSPSLVLHKMDKAITRKNFIEQTGNDGRYRTKVVKDKKKEQSRTACKETINYE